MNQELIRPYSTDGIQLPGLLYTPDVPTNKIEIQVIKDADHAYTGKYDELEKVIDTYLKENA